MASPLPLPLSPPPPSQPTSPAHTHPTAPPLSSAVAPPPGPVNTDAHSDASTIVDEAVDGPVSEKAGGGVAPTVDRTASGEEVIWVDWEGAG